MKRWVKGMRDSFFNALFDLAKKDRGIILLTSDTGAICHDVFKKSLPGQYINVGIAEQNMVGLASGLALSGKCVYVYAIVPFVTMRCYEQIRIDICCMDLPVTIVGIGAGFDYSTLGPTHHGTEDLALMRALPRMAIYSPSDSRMADAFADLSYRQRRPQYIRLDREGSPAVYNNTKNIDIQSGFHVLRGGRDVCIIATGRMVVSALQVARALSEGSIAAGVIDVFRLKPFNAEGIWQQVKNVKHVITLEEHFITGGLGTQIAELISLKQHAPVFKPIGIPHSFCREYGTRHYLQRMNRIDIDSVSMAIKKLVRK
jgi:transketolase